MTGTAVVTGGTAGIGKEVARGLAATGRPVAVIGRDPLRGARAELELRRTSGNGSVWFVKADLGLMGEVERLAGELTARWPALSHLVHSAGVVRGRRVLTADGVESNFAVNYLSRFALTRRLLPALEAAGRPGATARVVIVGGAARNGPIRFRDVNLTGGFSTWRAVLQFCHANDVFTRELACRLRASATVPRVTITSLKVGVVRTDIRREFPRWMRVLVPLLFDSWLTRTPAEVGEAVVRLLVDPAFEGLSGALFSYVLSFKPARPSARAVDRREGMRLWDLSDRLVAQANGAQREVALA